jgi:hypothetical protein
VPFWLFPYSKHFMRAAAQYPAFAWPSLTNCTFYATYEGSLIRKTACLLAAMAALTAAPVSAGNLSDPIVTPLIIAQDTAASTSRCIAIVVILALLAAIPALVD